MKPFQPFWPSRETILPRQQNPPDTSAADLDGKLEVSVLFTSPESTVAALRRATSLLSGLDGRISLIEVQAVPYPLPLDSPPVALDFTKRRLLAIAGESEREIAVYVYLSRFRWPTLIQVLKHGTVLVIGCRKKWWPDGKRNWPDDYNGPAIRP